MLRALWNRSVRIGLGFVFTLIIGFFVYNLAFSNVQDAKEGIVTYLRGTAKKQKLQDIHWRSVGEKSRVVGGERVRTLSQSRAELEFLRLDRIRMAPNTTIDILKLYEETKERRRETNIVLQKGDLWASVAKRSNLRLKIATPVAAAAITGTSLRMSVADDSSTELKVYRGEVVITNAKDVDAAKARSIEPHEIEGPHEVPGPHEVSLEEWALIVRQMQKVKVGKDGRLVYSGDFSLADADEQSDWVKWNLERDRLVR